MYFRRKASIGRAKLQSIELGCRCAAGRQPMIGTLTQITEQQASGQLLPLGLVPRILAYVAFGVFGGALPAALRSAATA
jgi:hypothetical protein